MTYFFTNKTVILTRELSSKFSKYFLFLLLDQPRTTPPNIKPTLRPAIGQIKSRVSPAPSKPDNSKTSKTKTKETVTQKIVKKDSEKEETQVGAEKVPPGGLTVSSSSGIPQSLSNTSQAVSDIPTSPSEVQEPEKNVFLVRADTAEFPQQEDSKLETEIADNESPSAIEEATNIQKEQDSGLEEMKAEENENIEEEVCASKDENASQQEDVKDASEEMLEHELKQKQEEEEAVRVLFSHGEDSRVYANELTMVKRFA